MAVVGTVLGVPFHVALVLSGFALSWNSVSWEHRINHLAALVLWRTSIVILVICHRVSPEVYGELEDKFCGVER